MGVNFRLDGNAKGSVKAVQDLNKALAETEKQTESTVREQQKFERQAKRIREAIDPQEKYNRQVQETARLVKEGKISVEEAQRATERYQRSLERAAQSQKSTFGPEFLSKVTSVAAGFISVGAAVSAATRFFTQLEEQAQKAADASLTSVERVGKLQQLPGATANLAFARQLVATGVAPDVGSGADIAFALTSAGLSAEEKAFVSGRIGASRAVPAEELPGVATNIKKAQNQLQLGTFAASTNKLLAASEFTDTTLTKIAEAATRFGTDLEGAGFSGDVGLAALTAILRSAPNPEQASTRLSAFLRESGNRGFARDTLGGTLEAIQSQIAAGATAKDVLGSEDAVKGFRNLRQNRNLFDQTLAAVVAAPQTDLVGSRFGSLEREDPIFRSAKRRQEAERRLAAVDESKFSEVESLFERLRAERIAGLREQGSSEVFIGAQRAAFAAADVLGGELGSLRQTLQAESLGTDTGVSASLLRDIRDLLERQVNGQPTRTRAE